MVDCIGVSYASISQELEHNYDNYSNIIISDDGRC